MTTPPPGTDDTPELKKLRLRVEALARKRDDAEARLTGLLAALLPLDDLLADTALRAEQLGRSGAGRTGVLAAAVHEQTDAAHQMLRAELARCQVRPMDLVGKTADPVEAQVLTVEPHPTAPEGTVLRETVTGFRLGTDCLRRADVVLAVPGPGPAAEPDAPAGQPDGETARERRNQPRRISRARRRQPLPLPSKPSKRRR
ncbi:nucleotide exchange factor GrpE [Streptomyces sp. H27-C3]|uniref:nucleotide exchange factor GrpE n=1 Tax=Streptomyces sp. H27-C3 TaxID=3046305 RepID=UPI0024B8E1CC|nr:nucleotide exchange factor GrpE [Streptomyces sp. H27-C3]MDJ0465265.1 nucleotide exchange factor GrpE [Streptomyces sp. H27-C3]